MNEHDLQEAAAEPLDSEDLRRHLVERQVKHLYTSGFVGYSTSLVVALVLLFFIRDSIPALGLYLWFGLLLATLLLRMGLNLLHHYRPDLTRPEVWITLFLSGIGLSGIIWGMSAPLFYRHLTELEQVFHMLIMGGLVAGALTTLSIVYRGYLLYLVCCLTPLVIHLSMSPAQSLHSAMAALICVYSAMMLVVARQINRATLSAITLVIENLGLASARSESERKFRTLAMNTPSAVFIIQDDFLKYTNPACEELTGYSRKELDGMTFERLIHPDHRQELMERARERISSAEQEPRPRRYEFMIRQKDGTDRWVDFTAATMPFRDRPAILGNCIDISKRKAAQEQLKELAATDDLTGAANRRAFIERGREEVARAWRYARPLALIWIDVDHFKRVNDTYGHQAGDEVLRSLVGIMDKARRETDILARMGGEEFSLLLPETSLEQAAKMAARLRTMVEGTPIKIEDHPEPVFMTISLGVACLGPNINTLQNLMAAADQAMYMAKQRGRNQVVLWPIPA